MVGFLQGQKTSGKKLWNIGGNEVGMGWVHCGVVATMRLWSISNECNSSCPLSLPETVVWCLVGASRAWHGCWCHGTAMVPPVTSSIGGQQVSWDLTTQWKWTHIFFGNKSVPLIPESIYVVDCYDQHIIRQTKYFDWLGQPLGFSWARILIGGSVFWRLRAPHDSGGEDGGQVPWFPMAPPMAPVSSGQLPNLVAFLASCLCRYKKCIGTGKTLFLRYAGATMPKSVLSTNPVYIYPVNYNQM